MKELSVDLSRFCAGDDRKARGLINKRNTGPEDC